MAYCTVSDIEGKFKGTTFTTSTAVKATTVTDLIDNYSAIIDGRISNMYQVPVTGTESLKILKQACILYVAGEVEETIAQGQVEDDERKRPSTMRKAADDIVSQIESGRLALSDATLASDADTMIASGNVSNSVSPKWERDRRQW